MLREFIEMMNSLEQAKKARKSSENNVVRLGDPVCYLCGTELDQEEGQYGCENCQKV